MRCIQAMKLTVGLALDDLDVEVRRDVEAHLASCGECRRAVERERAAVERMRAAGSVDTSAARRDQAAAAMKAAHQELLERALLSPRRGRRRWLAGLAAAGLLALGATTALLTFRSAPDVLRVRDLGGGAVVFRPGLGEGSALSHGDAVRRGDTVSVDGDTIFEGPGNLRLLLKGGSTAKFEVDGKSPLIVLLQGSLEAWARGVPLTIRDRSNASITVRDCDLNVKLAVVGPYLRRSGAKKTVAEHCEEVGRREGVRITPAEGVEHRKVAFGEGDLKEFIQAMAEQGIDVVEEEEKGAYRALFRPGVRPASMHARIRRGQQAEVKTQGDVTLQDLGGSLRK
ncbi:MAG: hypothetical protein HY716_10160 [Planctomycetes bacterium]|nr:hypothetical protein [Planctomycetota bacterium]